MACGTPTVVSSHPSLDEASGGVAIRVEPSDPEAIAAGIEQALTGVPASIAQGLEHARRFTWRACGEAMLRGYEGTRGP
jgi:glycosyltransferase involved in cell wall biosynthesis